MSVFLAVKSNSVADTWEEGEDLTVLIGFRSWFGLQLSILRTFLKLLEYSFSRTQLFHPLNLYQGFQIFSAGRQAYSPVQIFSLRNRVDIVVVVLVGDLQLSKVPVIKLK